MYISFKYLPVSEVIALGFLGPIITIISSRIILKEKMNITRILAIIFSIIGSILILRPDKILINYNYYNLIIILPLFSTLFFVISKLLTRHLAYKKESPEKLVSYLLILMVPVSFVFAVLEWQYPHACHIPWLVFLGFLAMAAHYSFSNAYALSEVSFLMPFGFTKFISSTMIGYFVFSEVPRSMDIWIGIIFIFISIIVAISKKNIYYNK
jgi:drug/metabolite transporter (DMT)-like permease